MLHLQVRFTIPKFPLKAKNVHLKVIEKKGNNFFRFLAHQKTSKLLIFQKFYAGGTLEKVQILAMEMYSIPSKLYITDVEAYTPHTVACQFHI